jgi:hypothetical protein
MASANRFQAVSIVEAVSLSHPIWLKLLTRPLVAIPSGGHLNVMMESFGNLIIIASMLSLRLEVWKASWSTHFSRGHISPLGKVYYRVCVVVYPTLSVDYNS